MLNQNLVLKCGELFTAGNIESDGSRQRAAGLYFRDTRHLSTFEVTIDGTTPEILSTVQSTLSKATVVSSNRLIERDQGSLPPQKLLLVEDISLDQSLKVTLSIQNMDSRSIAFQLGLHVAADFRDLFDIRGFHRQRRGRWIAPRAHAQGIELGYEAVDGLRTGTLVTVDQPCTIAPSTTTTDFRDGSFLYLMNAEPGEMHHELHEIPGATIAFDLELQSHEIRIIHFVAAPQPASSLPEHAGDPALESAHVVTDNEHFNKVLRQCRQDLDGLQTPFPHGSLPAAGIPWFVAPFGRDSLITGLQTLHLSPDRAEATVRALAALQGTRFDEFREEEPGKIPHEMRYGEMARVGEVPHSPYYGSVDATPLWLWLLAETVIWTGDRTLLADLAPNIAAVLDWIPTCGDIDADGLIEYRTESAGLAQIRHQVWKDSQDSLNFSDGSAANGPVAAVEVQGYVFAAYSRLAEALDSSDPMASTLRDRAEQMRILIEDRFWLEDERTYAQALDGEKRPVSTSSSNVGHLLACGVSTADRAGIVAGRLLGPDMNSGWGIRTLSSDAATYNPMSYHNGSVWPHDNSLIGAGFYRYGDAEAGHVVSTALFDAAQRIPEHRLPELYCGFDRAHFGFEHPVSYPVSCSPQAWAAGALPFLVRGMLGLSVDPQTGSLNLDPNFPEWLNDVTINNLRVLGSVGTLRVHRDGIGYAIESSGLPVQQAEPAISR